jgi:AGZA family xanthine/uracil permease-like MFS transporter
MRLVKFKLNHYINYIVIGVLTLVLGAMTLAGNRFDNSLIFLMEKMSISIILAVSLSLVVGFVGELSLGHAGFMSLGAFSGIIVSFALKDVIAFGPLVLIIFTTFSGNIAAGISLGILADVFIKVCTGKFKEIHWVMYLLCIPLILYFIV